MNTWGEAGSEENEQCKEQGLSHTVAIKPQGNTKETGKHCALLKILFEY